MGRKMAFQPRDDQDMIDGSHQTSGATDTATSSSSHQAAETGHSTVTVHRTREVQKRWVVFNVKGDENGLDCYEQEDFDNMEDANRDAEQKLHELATRCQIQNENENRVSVSVSRKFHNFVVADGCREGFCVQEVVDGTINWESHPRWDLEPAYVL